MDGPQQHIFKQKEKLLFRVITAKTTKKNTTSKKINLTNPNFKTVNQNTITKSNCVN